MPSIGDGGTEKSEKKVQAYEKVYNIGNQWICADCILERVKTPARPRRQTPHPMVELSKAESGLDAADSKAPEKHPSSLFSRIRQLATMTNGSCSTDIVESMLGHLRFYLKMRFGESEGYCESCGTAFTEVQPTRVYSVEDQLVCIDCVLERVDSMDRLRTRT